MHVETGGNVLVCASVPSPLICFLLFAFYCLNVDFSFVENLRIICESCYKYYFTLAAYLKFSLLTAVKQIFKTK